MFRHSAAALDFCAKLEDLIEDQSKWSQATFGSDSERGPIGPLKHLEKEAVEAQRAFSYELHDGEFKTELADCLLLMLDAIRRGGFKIGDIIDAAQAKMVINRGRTWPKPTSDEPVEHVR